MMPSRNTVDVYIEAGEKRTFACAVEWPGWCRSGRNEGRALQALHDYASRYARVVHATPLEFQPPAVTSAYTVVERLQGNASTDFGAPQGIPSVDTRPLDDTELARLQVLLGACWQAFDAAVQAAAGRELRKGPRGGGRDLAAIVQHVLGAETGYLARLGWKLQASEEGDPATELIRTRGATLDAVATAARGEIAPRGPRGGVRWPPRYFVRREAWHVLDHAWELEDRAV